MTPQPAYEGPIVSCLYIRHSEGIISITLVENVQLKQMPQSCGRLQ
jgi:hypothetical protein